MRGEFDVVEAARLLGELGLPRAMAAAVAYLATVEEASSPEVERATGLRSPEASLALQRLRRRGFVSKRPRLTGLRGRPTDLHRLTLPIEDVVASLARAEGASEASARRLLALVGRRRQG